MTDHIRSQLEEERRIIDAATAGPWQWGQLSDEAQTHEEKTAAMGEMVAGDTDSLWIAWSPRPDGQGSLAHAIAGDHERSPANAAFIAHARTALPNRNAQVEAVLAKCDELEQPVKVGHGGEMIDLGTNSAVAEIRRAIEEAGRA